MKKALIISLIFAMVFSAVGCEMGETTNVSSKLYKGDGYSLSIPEKGYRYEKDYDDGAIEDKWESITRDDISIEVITYEHTDKELAQKMFLRENEDYIFEDLMGYSLCGMEMDGDTLWFNLYEANGNTYIVSWEYPKNADEKTKTELSAIAQTFKTE
ncbi:MAG: hypothetical protein IKC07_01800 [Clostridia bacterium]|nr:hypothetical protein [Clostridia bacterium]